ncbi:hypothetical protein [Glycomyces albidus]|uniref:Uncharacterized protein n=1 Tax=Glycomyces albidus TaxID=2656774 RepID=A0A6L5G5A8_9ACTN|nr:hypothetical protein [Glycomyces albidus]MQM24822.1 hypothetical protein [Glycomyces albidus]
MTYPPPNPFDPSQQQPGYGQPSAPQHYTTDADPYSRPDTYGPGTGYGNPPLNVHPGSAPPGQPYSPGAPGYVPGQPTGGFQPPPPPGPPGGAFQPGQAAPPPPRSGGNTTLIVGLVAVILVVAIGGTVLALSLGGNEDDPVAQETTEAAEETTEAEEETSAAEPSEEATTAEGESTYRVPEEGECIENVETGFYVVDCESADAYWYVVHIEQSPADPDPTDPYHAVAAADACDGFEWTQYYYTDTAIAAGRDWDPEIDSITAIYCVRPVE